MAYKQLDLKTLNRGTVGLMRVMRGGKVEKLEKNYKEFLVGFDIS